MFSDLTGQNTWRALLFSLVLVIAKYLQRLDVAHLIVKKWATHNHQSQLKAYFMNQKEGVIIYEPIGQDSSLESSTEDVAPKIYLSNGSVSGILGFEVTETIPPEVMKAPTFDFKQQNLDSTSLRSIGVNPELTSLQDLLIKPALLGEEKEIVVSLK